MSTPESGNKSSESSKANNIPAHEQLGPTGRNAVRQLVNQALQTPDSQRMHDTTEAVLSQEEGRLDTPAINYAVDRNDTGRTVSKKLAQKLNLFSNLEGTF